MMMMLSQDENGPPVSGAAVDAYTERLKGVLGDGGAAAAASATYGVRAGNGSLKPIPSPPPTQAPTNSSVASATGLPFLGSILFSEFSPHDYIHRSYPFNSIGLFVEIWSHDFPLVVVYTKSTISSHLWCMHGGSS